MSPTLMYVSPTSASRSQKHVYLDFRKSLRQLTHIHRKRLILTSVSSLYLSSYVTPFFLKIFQVWGVLKGDQKLMQTPFFWATFHFLEHSHKRTSINYVDWILRILTPLPLVDISLCPIIDIWVSPPLARQRSLWIFLTTYI